MEMRDGPTKALPHTPRVGTVIAMHQENKKTEVGFIPEDWELGKLADCGVFRSGSGFPLVFQGHESGDYPFLKVSDMNNEGNELFMSSANHWVSEDVRRALGATVFRSGSIVFAKIGAAIFLERKRLLSQDSCLDNNMMAFSLVDHNACQRYFHYLFLHSKLGKLVSATALPSLSGRQIGAVSVPIPPPPEQRAIAEALSDADGLLSALDALIAKRRAIKQAAMQQLLTGKTRLPGFSGEWETKRLGELGTFSKGRGIKRQDVSDDGLPCVRYGELYTRYDSYISSAESRIPLSVALTALPIKTGDLLFAGSGETADEIGRCAAYLGNAKAYAGGDIVVLTPSGQNSMYLGHLMNHSIVSVQKARMGQGDAVVHISAHKLAQVRITIPPLNPNPPKAGVG